MATALLTGLVLGSIYILVGSGINLVRIATGAFNFAQAAVVMVGAFIAYEFGVERGHSTLIVILVAAAVGAVIGVVTEFVAIRPVAGKGLHGELVTTVGASTILTGLVVVIWGTEVRPVAPFVSDDVVSIAGGRVTVDGLVIIGVAIATCLGLWAWSRLTMTGLAALALSEDRDAATLRGVNVRYLSILAMAAAGAIGGAAGPIIGTQTLAVSTVAAVVILKSFLVLIVGGMGSFPGLLVGGLAIGSIEAGTVRYLGSEYSTFMLFALLLVVLMVRPQGIFGQTHERTV
ncbi:branched-chain amino acid ABC transporter permease [Nocardioides alkalitolerans]|uniref:branched-chain amino acid ABC transporter permease n=1 Tax=Nocardioides alkalitolerans TaxID=281714 RepID=UPI000427A772|nr:branched-chain amino acid ABC transporter permease [Nocardioides alkalitolerans]